MLSKPAQASLAKAEVKHSQARMELDRLKSAGADPEFTEQAERTLDQLWDRIMGMRGTYGGTGPAQRE